MSAIILRVKEILDGVRVVEMTEALAERRALFGDDHPTVAYSLSTLATDALGRGLNPKHSSGQQERLEGVVNQAIYSRR